MSWGRFGCGECVRVSVACWLVGLVGRVSDLVTRFKSCPEQGTGDVECMHQWRKGFLQLVACL